MILLFLLSVSCFIAVLTLTIKLNNRVRKDNPARPVVRLLPGSRIWYCCSGNRVHVLENNK